ncbi:hypothetical protein ACFQY3_20885 [Paenibacillus farraposensis]|uniref:hypothetical protein n=1 Tax=Paenibacillus farraposensis TaxID=2807095 RepID=UPI003613052B
MTREQLEQAAARLNLQISDSSDPRMTEEEWRNKVIKEGRKTPTAPQKAKPAQTPSAPKTPANSAPSNASKPASSTSIPKNPDKPLAKNLVLHLLQVSPSSLLLRRSNIVLHRGVV